MLDFLRSEGTRLRNTVVWSWQGWVACWHSEKTLRQWALANLISASAAFALPLSAGERAVIVGLGLVVLAAELLNTAIETTVDYISPATDPRARKAKNAASAGVALAAIAAGAAWLIVLIG